MPFNLLLLPLLGGFLFVTKWNRLRYYTLRMDGQRLLLTSACAGAAFLFLSNLAVALCEPMAIGGHLNRIWHRTIPFEYSGRAALALLIGALLPGLLNRYWEKEEEVQRVVLDKADALEVMFRRAAGDGRLVSLTTKNGKVYVGRVTRNFNPAFPLDHVSIVPVVSGYRDATDKRVKFTNFYLDIYDKLRAEIEAELLAEAKLLQPQLAEPELKKLIRPQIEQRMLALEFEIVVPRGEIQSVNFFDRKIFEKNFQVNPPPSE